MPTYTIRTPDGRPIRIQAQDVLSALKSAANGATGYLTTAARAAPFLTEAGAGWSSGVRSLDDLLAGRTPDPAANWTRARAEQQGVVDSFRREHPVLANSASALGAAAPLGVAGLGISRAARSAALPLPAVASSAEAAGNGAVTKKLMGTTVRNAFGGALVSGAYGAAQPGTFRQRMQSATDALAPGAAWGAGLPLGAGAAAAFARHVGEMAPGAGAIGSELVDTLRRAATGRTATDQSRKIPILADRRGEIDAVRHLHQMGVTPEALEQAQSAAGGKPITTAEAIGPNGMELAQGLRGRAGTTDTVANGVLGQRAASRPDRVLMGVSKVAEAHPLSVLGDLDQLLADSRKNGEPYMEEARSLAPPFSARLDQLVSAPESQARWPAVMNILDSTGREPFDLSYQVAEDGQTKRLTVPNLDFLDTLKDQLQGALEGQAGPLSEKQQAIKKIADGLQASLTTGVPSGMAYAKAHEFRGDLASTEAAWRSAQGRLFNPAIDPATFDNEFYKLLPFQQDTATAAGAGDIVNLAYQQPFSTAPLSDPDVIQKMQSLFTRSGAKQLTDALGAEGAMADFERPTPNGLPGLDLRLRAAGQAPLNMAGRNALGAMLYQDPATTAQAMRNYGPAPNAFDTMRLRLPPIGQYGAAGLLGALQARGGVPNASQP